MKNIIFRYYIKILRCEINIEIFKNKYNNNNYNLYYINIYNNKIK